MTLSPTYQEAEQSLETVADFIRFAASQFHQSDLYFGHGTDNAWDEAVAIVLQMLDLPQDYPQGMLTAKLLADEKKHLIHAIFERVENRKPLAYITNKAYFVGLEFYIDERVLVPRSPIAELIENDFYPWLEADNPRILDLCCGSGCIGLAIAAYIDDAEVVLSDISDDAITVADINNERLGLYPKAQTVVSDLFESLSDEKFDLIVSNPPYVDSEDLSDMPAEYQHEPEIGLGSGEDGLDITRRILEQAAEHLTEQGCLIVEVGNSWPALEEAFPNVPFSWIEFEKGGDGVFLLTRQQLLEHFS
ncbi:50S ribosomal protein L3 N(5)-glutamine methyltransferase [Kangiella koreensis]|uniref:Ribosomal protein uL3 glutamine methyltransferase n=1 Tax=Kangiella koreensis (strain DSM 16069 / JCM 12317 / KCTC 12182 / SW-125) TaxID=523791 RepID=C7RAT3_KANKD|nr:50S ribosomal protein L3 N(5)-glutamine methyltransferase [Kangiella koreensis]ACV26375.1 modification methylase, HemK family [Kangiella koreensis DSM 16069]